MCLRVDVPFGALVTNLSAALLLDALHRKDVLSRGGQLHFPTGERQLLCSFPSALGI